ncbi:MAG TPA: hypothetical protein VHJ17_25950 [Thermomonospora sp.]|nr:hypothetical protein [Thermomonospora sp.]
MAGVGGPGGMAGVGGVAGAEAVPSWGPPPGPGPQQQDFGGLPAPAGDQAWQMQPGQPGAYADPGYTQQQPAGGRSNRSLAIVVGVLVTVAVVAVGIVMWPDGGGKPSAGASASATPRNASQKNPPDAKPAGPRRRQAVAVNELLDASAVTRGELGRALAAAARCKGLPTAIAGFQRVAQRRTAQINRTRALKVGALRNGERLRAALQRSFQLSLQTDQAFLAWAQSVQGCKGRPPRDGNYARGNSLSAQATLAKRRFTVLWNPVARQEGLPARSDTQF